MADTLVERTTGQTRATDVNTELQLMMPLDTLINPDDHRPTIIPEYGPLPAGMAWEIVTSSQGRKWWAHPIHRENRNRAPFPPAIACEAIPQAGIGDTTTRVEFHPRRRQHAYRSDRRSVRRRLRAHGRVRLGAVARQAHRASAGMINTRQPRQRPPLRLDPRSACEDSSRAGPETAVHVPMV
jgi:hypothetical protein